MKNSQEIQQNKKSSEILENSETWVNLKSQDFMKESKVPNIDNTDDLLKNPQVSDTDNINNIDDLLKKSIETLIETKSPIKFFFKVWQLQSDIRDYMNDVFEKLWDFLDYENEKTLQTKIMWRLAVLKYHKAWLNFMDDYIKDSKYWQDDVFLKTYTYLVNKTKAKYKTTQKINEKSRHIISEQEIFTKSLDDFDMWTLSFRQVLNIVRCVELDIISTKWMNEIDQVHKVLMWDIITDFLKNKSWFYDKFTSFLDSNKIEWDQKRLYWRYMKTMIIIKYYPNVFKCFYWYLAWKPVDKKDFINLRQSAHDVINFNLWLFSSLMNCKNFIVKLNRTSFWYMFKPFFLFRLAKNLNFIWKDRLWLKVKYYMLFGLSNNYSEYQESLWFFTELEAFLQMNLFEIMKIWWFWIITVPFLFIIFAFYLPVWVFIALLIITLKILSSVFQNIKEHTEYKIKFNLWINMVAGLSIAWFLASSIFLTGWDAFKFGYEKTKWFINVMSALTPVSIIDWLNMQWDILWISWESSWNMWILDYNYLSNDKSYYDVMKLSKKSDIVWEIKLIWNKDDMSISDDSNKQLKTKAEIRISPIESTQIVDKTETKNYFKGKMTISNGLYLWNIIDMIITRYEISKKIELSNNKKQLLIKKTIDIYTSLHIDEFRKYSMARNPHKLRIDQLHKWISSGFEFDMVELENIVRAELWF